MVLFAVGVVTGVSDGQTPVNEPIKSVRISGRVTDITGAPFANTAVKIKFPGHAQSTIIAQTDENGSFIFLTIAPQLFDLFFEAPGFRQLTLPAKTANSSTAIDVGNIVLEVAPTDDPSPLYEHLTVAYEPSTFPNWLKSEPGATFLPGPPADHEETIVSHWQTATCSKVNRSGRRIVSMNHVVEFYVPMSAHLTKTTDADYLEYHVRYGPISEKCGLTSRLDRWSVGIHPMMFRAGPFDGRRENGSAIASKVATCVAFPLMAAGGVTSISWQADSQLTKASTLRLRTTLMESWTRCAAESCRFDDWLARSMMIIFPC